MNEFYCTDLDGNSISYFTQWDSNIEILIYGDFPETPVPTVYFNNKDSQEAYAVLAEATEEPDCKKVHVPNLLLEEAKAIQIHVCLNGEEAEDEKKCIMRGNIPVRERKKPNDYIYYEDDLVVSLEQLVTRGENDIQALESNVEIADALIEELGTYNDMLSMFQYFQSYIWFGDDVLGVQVDFDNNIFMRMCGASGKTAGQDFDAYPMYGDRVRCNLTDDGVVTAEYGDSAFTETGELTQAVTVDGVTYPIGTHVQVMVKQPKFYYRIFPIEIKTSTAADAAESNQGVGNYLTKAAYFISENKYDGFKLHPAFYDQYGNEIDYVYIGAYEGVTKKYDGENVFKQMSYSGLDTSNVGIPRPDLEQRCSNRGNGWYLFNIKLLSMEQLLMIVEYGGFNMQELTESDGAVAVNRSTSYGPRTGSTSSLGNESGAASSTKYKPTGGTTTPVTETADGKVAFSYRGRENPWGGCHETIDGINILPNSSYPGGVPYICDDYNFSNSADASNYHSVGFSLPGNGWIQNFGYSSAYDWVMLPLRIKDTYADLPIGDLSYRTQYNYPLSNVSAILNGGYMNMGTNEHYSDRAGIFYLTVATINSGASYASGRIVYVPQPPEIEDEFEEVVTEEPAG